MDQKEFGSWMIQRRKELRISQQQLANMCGVSQQLISLYERGLTQRNYDLVEKIKTSLGMVNVAGILSEEDRKKTIADVFLWEDKKGTCFVFSFLDGNEFDMPVGEIDHTDLDKFLLIAQDTEGRIDLNSLYLSLNLKGKAEALKKIYILSKSHEYTEEAKEDNRPEDE